MWNSELNSLHESKIVFPHPLAKLLPLFLVFPHISLAPYLLISFVLYIFPASFFLYLLEQLSSWFLPPLHLYPDLTLCHPSNVLVLPSSILILLPSLCSFPSFQSQFTFASYASSHFPLNFPLLISCSHFPTEAGFAVGRFLVMLYILE